MYVIPLNGLLVRDPRSRVPLPVTGAEVPESSFWLRRLRDESIAIATPPEAEPETAPAAKPETPAA